MPRVQMIIRDAAKLVRDAFALADEKPPRIIFISEMQVLGGLHWVQMFVGDGAELVQDAFALAEEEFPAVC